ncbi:MAG: GNAT family N-acetyltransferase [Pirellulales bacterium]
MSAIVEVNDIESLQDFRLLWQALLPETPGGSFFHTLDWLTVYWRHLGQRQRLRVLVAYAGSRPIGILPLCVRTEEHRFGPLRVLGYPADGWANCCGPIGGNATATLLAAMRYLRSISPDWDMVDLRGVATLGWDRWRTQRAMRSVGFPTARAAWREFAVVDHSDASPSRQVSTCQPDDMCRQDESCFMHRGRWQYVRYRPLGAAHDQSDPRWDLLEQCGVVAERSRRQRPEEAGAQKQIDITDSFFRETHEAAAKLGMLDVNLLYADGLPVAFSYNFHTGGRVVSLWAGADCKSRSDAARLLTARMFENSRQRGDTRTELQCGLDVTEDWSVRHEQVDRITHYRPTILRAQAVRLERWWQEHRARRPETAVLPTNSSRERPGALIAPERPRLRLVGAAQAGELA